MKRIELGSVELGVLSNILKKADFLAPLTLGQLEQVLTRVMLCSYDAGETVFRQGSEGDAFYIVYKGKVEVARRRLLVLKRTLAALGPGECFGEIALVSREPRSATVTCVEPALLFTLLSNDFKSVLDENLAAAKRIQGVIAQRRFDSAHQA